ncbi:hypothetical protein ACGYK6_16125 [Sulfitobacter sp. 1A15333]|uniref:hypothetical protein n=1 Tax=unclassified Sulfitobacter TaxID=196795 RepID=UPI0023E27094|nr:MULTISPECIES: hypothetical protein [unclassified Sulfitobacter]
MTIDWEAEMKEVRSKATEAARHGERTVGGVAGALQLLQVQSKKLADIEKAMDATQNHLGSLEADLQSLQSLQRTTPLSGKSRPLWQLLSAGIGFALGIALSGVFFWS